MEVLGRLRPHFFDLIFSNICRADWNVTKNFKIE